MQTNKAKISIIIPAYNVGDYIKRAIDSVLKQTFHDFKIYIVDDGSTDNTGYVCDELAKTDNRINVIHQKNAGAHNARNAALDIIDSKYVCFFDGDDYIENDMLTDLYNIAENNESDLVISGFYIDTYYTDDNFVTSDYIPYTRDEKLIDIFNDKTSFRLLAYKNFDKNMFYSPWNKLYNVSYLKNNNLKFPVTYRDDFPFVLSVIRDIDRVSYTRKQYYHFIRKRSESETQKYVKTLYEKREEEHEKMIELYDHWSLLYDKNSIEMIARRYLDRLIECMVNLFNTNSNLNKNDIMLKINEYLNNGAIDELIKFAKPNKFYLKLMYIPLKLKNTNLCYSMAKFIESFKRKHIKEFAFLKANR